ncbi:MAG TPA: serine hydrolase domain-containing protein, partial [Polyangiaceae bacterium]|nr:serine hydrolase domain-containing protein [Polyangiaceae bacterium]
MARAAVAEDGVVGTGIALIVDGKLEYAGGIGSRTVGGAAVDGDTLFLVGSTTKMLTAATVMSLVDDGLLDVNAPLSTYLPKLSVERPFDVHDMTLSGLLSHTDGLEDTNAAQCSFSRFSEYGASDPVTLWGKPGTFFDYSNNDMALAAQVIESVVGTGSYEQAVRERIFTPAEMASATFDAVTAARSVNVATGYYADPTGAFTKPVTVAQTASECPILEPAGYAIASARDFGKFVEALLAGGGAMLQPDSVTRMETGILPTGYNPRDAETYGFGLFVDQIGGETVIDHSGDIPPFHSAVFFVPQARFGVVMLINADSSKTIGKVMEAAVTLFAPPPAALTPPAKTEPSAWRPYTGSYVDSYGALGAFSLTIQGTELSVNKPDGSSIGSLNQLDADHWVLAPSTPGAPSVDGVFSRDAAGTV